MSGAESSAHDTTAGPGAALTCSGAVAAVKFLVIIGAEVTLFKRFDQTLLFH